MLPRVRKLGGPAKVEVAIRLRNLTRKERNVQLAVAVRGPGIDTRFVPAAQSVAGRGGRADVVTRFEIPRPKLWQPGRPALYGLAVSAGLDGKRLSQYRLSFGVKKLQRGRNGGAAAERPQAQPARRQHPRGRPRQRRGPLTAPAHA